MIYFIFRFPVCFGKIMFLAHCDTFSYALLCLIHGHTTVTIRQHSCIILLPQMPCLSGSRCNPVQHPKHPHGSLLPICRKIVLPCAHAAMRLCHCMHNRSGSRMHIRTHLHTPWPQSRVNAACPCTHVPHCPVTSVHTASPPAATHTRVRIRTHRCVIFRVRFPAGSGTVCLWSMRTASCCPGIPFFIRQESSHAVSSTSPMIRILIPVPVTGRSFPGRTSCRQDSGRRYRDMPSRSTRVPESQPASGPQMGYFYKNRPTYDPHETHQ